MRLRLYGSGIKRRCDPFFVRPSVYMSVHAHSLTRKLCYRKDHRAMNRNLGEEEVIGGRGWHHSKERWRLPIGPP